MRNLTKRKTGSTGFIVAVVLLFSMACTVAYYGAVVWLASEAIEAVEDNGGLGKTIGQFGAEISEGYDETKAEQDSPDER